MIDHFRFEVIPQLTGRYWPLESYTYGQHLFRIEIGYGGRRLVVHENVPPDEVFLTESYVEYFMRRAMAALREAIGKDASDKAEADLLAKQTAFVKAADDYRASVRRGK